jgi:hypothetical protein
VCGKKRTRLASARLERCRTILSVSSLLTFFRRHRKQAPSFLQKIEKSKQIIKDLAQDVNVLHEHSPRAAQ